MQFIFGSLLLYMPSTSFCQVGKSPHTVMQVGQSLPFQALGFHSAKALLEAIPDVCSLQQRNGTLMVVGLPSSGTAHILTMVNRQGKKQVIFKHHLNTYYIPPAGARWRSEELKRRKLESWCWPI